MTESFDEEGLLKIIKAHEISEEIVKLIWNWNNRPDPIKVTHEIMNKCQKFFLEISEYEQRMGSKLGIYQKDKINEAIVNLGELVSNLKNKITPSNNLQNRQLTI